MEKYNQYSISKIKNLIAQGAEAANDYASIDDLLYSHDYTLSEFELVEIGFQNPNFVPGEVKEYYRIGEPIIDKFTGTYKPSYNFADDKPEIGVSVVTIEWLNSFKSIFFGTSDEDIEAKGVYKIKGIELPSTGGDDETLILPIDWAVKTKIRTRAGLKAAVKKSQK